MNAQRTIADSSDSSDSHFTRIAENVNAQQANLMGLKCSVLAVVKRSIAA